MHDQPPPRKTRYLGCLAHNDSPDDLGAPDGFWWFNAEAQMWGAFARSQGLNDAFEALGAPTYSAVLTATDDDGYVLFHLLVISTQPVRPRQQNFIDQAKQWLTDQQVRWETPERGSL